eukprot:4306885-Pleurochrysis_carterae.AAC.1
MHATEPYAALFRLAVLEPRDPRQLRRRARYAALPGGASRPQQGAFGAEHLAALAGVARRGGDV